MKIQICPKRNHISRKKKIKLVEAVLQDLFDAKIIATGCFPKKSAQGFGCQQYVQAIENQFKPQTNIVILMQEVESHRFPSCSQIFVIDLNFDFLHC